MASVPRSVCVQYARHVEDVYDEARQVSVDPQSLMTHEAAACRSRPCWRSETTTSAAYNTAH